MFKNNYVLCSDSDSDDDFLLSVASNIPKLRQYPDRPDVLYKYTDSEFRARFRFSKETAVKICDMLDSVLAPKTNRCKSISTLNQLCIALRFLVTGCFQITCGDLFNCHKSTVCRKIPKVLGKIALLCRMHDIIKMPTTQTEIQRAKSNFYQIAGFPGVIGAIDCTHVKIQSPGGDVGEVYRNRKGYFSINVQCVTDSLLNICDIDARWPGSVHDQTILDNSFLFVRLTRKDFGDSVLLGDGGYANKNYILTPLSSPQTTAEKKYQRAHISTRNPIERLYGVLKRRFPALSLGLRVKVETILTSIVAAAVLHNLAIQYKDGFDDFEEVDINIIDNPIPNAVSNNAKRTALIENYFNSIS